MRLVVTLINARPDPIEATLRSIKTELSLVKHHGMSDLERYQLTQTRFKVELSSFLINDSCLELALSPTSLLAQTCHQL